MVIRPCSVCIACDQFAAANIAGNAKGILFSYHLAFGVKDKLHQAAVFFHLMPQALGIVAVDLDVAVKGLHLGGAVEGVVAVPGLVVRQQVACVVIAEEGNGAVFGIGRQAVARVVLVEFLHTLGDAFGAVAGFVVEQFFGIAGILRLLEMLCFQIFLAIIMEVNIFIHHFTRPYILKQIFDIIISISIN